MATAGPGIFTGSFPKVLIPAPQKEPQTKSWAERVGSSFRGGWQKNILEIILAKDAKGPFRVSETDCANLMRKIGLDLSTQVEAVQICPNGRGTILVTLKREVDVYRFCRHDVYEVSSTGIRAIHFKPGGKREVVVTLKNLHPNTRDDTVLYYLKKFAKNVANKVVHGVYADGPLKGLKNSERSFKLEILPNTNIPTYHVIDGSKVIAKYPGQQQTCARCHKTSSNCKGGAIAKKCEEAGGEKVDFAEYILQLWTKIGYVPDDEEIASAYDEYEDYVEQTGGKFTPTKNVVAPVENPNYGGVCIRKFPKGTEDEDILELLIASGLPEDNKDCVNINKNGVVSVNKLDNVVCHELIANLHEKEEFGKKLLCEGIIPRTTDTDLSGNANDTVDIVPSTS